MLRVIFGACCLLMLQACKTVKVTNSLQSIYGTDGRQDVYDHLNTPFAELVKSTAMKMASTQLDDNGDGTLKIKAKTWAEYEKICPDERFAKQLAPGSCSGFLVAPNLIATAGHCVKSLDECRSRAWIFGFYVDSKDKVLDNISKSKVYRCSDIDAQYKRQDVEGVDLALIRLDREVTVAKPIVVPRTIAVKQGDSLTMIGYPSGLPAKITTDDATTIREAAPNYPQFVTNLDAFAGSSGSAVFRSDDATLLGVLSAGEDDFEPSLDECKRPRRCTNTGCTGEKVIRANALATALRQATFTPTTPALISEVEAPIAIPMNGNKAVKISLPITTEALVERVTLVFSIKHPNVASLRATLTHPDGKTSVGQIGLEGNNIWRWSTMFRMSKFLDLPAKGNWVLTVEDTHDGDVFAGGDVSTISLTIN